MLAKDLIQELKRKSDPEFALFSKTLSNSDYIVIGVKNPVLRNLIKAHKKDEELKLDEFELGKYLEIDFVYFGLALSRLKTNKEKLAFLKDNIKYAKSWAITDTVSTYIKALNFQEFLWIFSDLYKRNNIYERRTAYVLGLKVYKDPNILQILKFVNQNEDYMVMMAEAWLLATVAIVYPNEIYSYLSDLNDDKLKRKTISKICESFRIDNAIKNKFKSLRKENK